MGTFVSKEEMKELRAKFKREGKTVVLCHGVFDLVHPGHIIYFQQAKAMGDVLVVSYTAARYVRKGPGRPYFDDEMRKTMLSAIGCIDYVMMSDGYTADDMIETVEPDLYVKGQEYAKAEDDITGKIGEEVALVRKHGGDVRYTSGQVFSSTKLINTAFPALTEEVKEYMQDFKQRYTMDDIKAYTEKMQDLKVLVVGDVIIDEYVFCEVQGLMSKNVAYSARLHRDEKYLGGSIAIARHIASFCNNVKLMAVVGKEPEFEPTFKRVLPEEIAVDFVYSDEYPTIVKKRYVSEDVKKDEVDKVFVINNIPLDMSIDKPAKTAFREKLERNLKEYDLVVLCDFGHGLIDRKTREIIEKQAKTLVINCQTNSSNYGTNLITKYTRADAFSLDDKELKLAFSDYNSASHQEKLAMLSNHLHSCGWHTMGVQGAEVIDENENIMRCPALTNKTKDTIGAGDAFFSLAALCTGVEAPWEIGTFMGNIAAALAANIVGNKKPVEKVNVLKYASTLMNV